MRIQSKLILALLIATTAMFAAMYSLMQWSFDRGFLDYVNRRDLQRQETLINNLQRFYRQSGSWEPLRRDHNLWRRLLEAEDDDQQPWRPPRRNEDDRPDRPHPPRPPTLLDADKQVVTGRFRSDFIMAPIKLGDQTVGWLALPPRVRVTEQNDLAFSQSQDKAFLVISTLMVAIALLIALPLARQFVTPIKRLAVATRQLAQGAYDVELKVSGKDELGQLARDFHQLAQTLQSNETARRRWIADISHELRTPLAIAKGELEALVDGVRPTNRDNLLSIQQEIEHLQKLINDLYELTNAEVGALRYQKDEEDLRLILQHALDRHHANFTAAGFQLIHDLAPSPAMVWADATRLSQLLDNLFSNTCKYADPGAQVRVSLNVDHDQVRLRIEDSGPGAPDEALPKLFDHLYRVENSRNRNTGGSGLGLAICRKIVEAHEGDISASRSPLGGLAIDVTLPAYHE
ncbi:ATP-binding protein [Hahella sp. HN01]|uniref:ATP-binding protein n=1 Tax=Hahella sp. HN01 TaxID=2847262 RepID=UPI001C1F0C08|nr:HAMP domain-containing protein [Hahella sp. HN01]